MCALADAALITAGVAGLGALISGSTVALELVRYGGAAFLLVLAVGALRRARRPERLDPAAQAPARLGPVVLTTLGLTFLNPHVYLDTVVLLGSLASHHGPEGRWAFAGGAVVGEPRCGSARSASAPGGSHRCSRGRGPGRCSTSSSPR